jgi:hypothetical protein
MPSLRRSLVFLALLVSLPLSHKAFAATPVPLTNPGFEQGEAGQKLG